jgi:glycerate dehydrogenase
MQKLNIVVIDGYTINPGDLDWSELAALGNLTVYDRSSPEEAAQRLADADIVLANKVRFDETLLSKLPRLKYISLSATGYNNLDVPSLQKHDILASNVSGYGAHAVAQHSIALLFELTNRVAHHHQKVREGAWGAVDDFCFWDQPMTELFGLTMGIIGWGAIGSRVGAIAHALGMKVIFHNRSAKDCDFAEQVSLENIWRESDVISLHCTLNEDTDRIIREGSLVKMKAGVILLNTSRGGLIDESALLAALDSGKVSGAGLDVLSVEPPKNGNPLIDHPKCIITSHNAWAPRATRQRLLKMAVDNIRSFMDGQPQHLIG